MHIFELKVTRCYFKTVILYQSVQATILHLNDLLEVITFDTELVNMHLGKLTHSDTNTKWRTHYIKSFCFYQRENFHR